MSSTTGAGVVCMKIGVEVVVDVELVMALSGRGVGATLVAAEGRACTCTRVRARRAHEPGALKLAGDVSGLIGEGVVRTT